MVADIDTHVVEILVTGIPNAGKTSFLSTLNPNTIVDGGWRLADIAVDRNLHMRFIEPPPQDSFDYLWLREVIDSADVDGFVIVCDSTRPELFGETIGVLQTVLALHDTACIVIANKQDDPNAWSAEDIRFAVNIPMHIPVLPCVASELEYVRDAVIELLYQIFQS